MLSALLTFSWWKVFSDEDSDAGYASLTDQSDDVFDTSPLQLKTYGRGKVFLDFVLSKGLFWFLYMYISFSVLFFAFVFRSSFQCSATREK